MELALILESLAAETESFYIGLEFQFGGVPFLNVAFLSKSTCTSIIPLEKWKKRWFFFSPFFAPLIDN